MVPYGHKKSITRSFGSSPSRSKSLQQLQGQLPFVIPSQEINSRLALTAYRTGAIQKRSRRDYLSLIQKSTASLTSRGHSLPQRPTIFVYEKSKESIVTGREWRYTRVGFAKIHQQDLSMIPQ